MGRLINLVDALVKTINKMERRIEDLESQLEEYERQVEDEVPVGFLGLGSGERHVLAALLLQHAVKVENTHYNSHGSLKVVVNMLRRRIAWKGVPITIEYERKRGYVISQEDREKIFTLIATGGTHEQRKIIDHPRADEVGGALKRSA